MVRISRVSTIKALTVTYTVQLSSPVIELVCNEGPCFPDSPRRVQGQEALTADGQSGGWCRRVTHPQSRARHLNRSPVAAVDQLQELSLIHISEPTRLGMISYAV